MGRMVQKTMTRRRVLGTAAMAATAVTAAPFVRGAFAAGTLNVAFWDHWVPGANDVMAKLCKEWAAKEKVELKIDFVTSQGDTLTLPSVGRIDIFKEAVGLDLTQMYPGSAPPNKELTDKWTWDFFLTAAEKCHKAGHPFGLAIGQTGDTANWVGAVFTAHGAELVDKDGNITVKSEPVKQVLGWFKKLVPFLPPDVFAWDDSSNNKALISGQAALIFNPPSAWAVAVRDAPKVAEQCWHFPSPKGPKGRFDPAQPSYWGIWKFSPNKAAAKSLAAYLWQKSSVEQLVAGSHGYDIPAFGTLRQFKTWAEEGPPKGGIWNYPPRGEVIESVSGSPAPASVANQIY